MKLDMSIRSDTPRGTEQRATHCRDACAFQLASDCHKRYS